MHNIFSFFHGEISLFTLFDAHFTQEKCCTDFSFSNLYSDVKFFDAGDYLCNATNKFGHQHASGSLVVKEHTRITGRPQDYEVEAGDSATFRCNAVYDADLRLQIKWLKDGELIDFETEPRFVQSSDQSLTITKTTELDSGTYTCLAQSELDSAEAQATLIVQDVPNPPALKWINCGAKDATVDWTPMGDNRAPILTYKIQYNTTFTPDTWETATGKYFLKSSRFFSTLLGKTN